MRYNTISGHSPTGEAFWIVAGIVVMLAFGDAFVLSALAFGLVTVIGALFTHRRAERRAHTKDAKVVAVSHLRPAAAVQNHRGTTSAHASWIGPSAAA